MYYGVIGEPMEIAITDLLKVGQLVVSRKYGDMELFSDTKHGRRGVVLEIEPVSLPARDQRRNCDTAGHNVKVVWQDSGETESMPDWFAAELLVPLPL